MYWLEGPHKTQRTLGVSLHHSSYGMSGYWSLSIDLWWVGLEIETLRVYR
jgi:hypothetical protein